MKKEYTAPETDLCGLDMLNLLTQSDGSIDPATEDQWGIIN